MIKTNPTENITEKDSIANLPSGAVKLSSLDNIERGDFAVIKDRKTGNISFIYVDHTSFDVVIDSTGRSISVAEDSIDTKFLGYYRLPRGNNIAKMVHSFLFFSTMTPMLT